MGVDLNAAALFVAVVEHKSFTEASRRLGVPISTVSRKIGELEKALGVRLLERSTRKLRLTGLGEDYYAHCRRGLVEFETGASMIDDRQADVSGTLRLSVPPSLADNLVVPLVGAFQAAYPNAAVKILVTDRKVDLIEEGVDIALRVGEFSDSSLIARRLLTYRSILVASPGYLDTSGAPDHPRALSAHHIVSFGGWHDQVVWKLAKGTRSQTVRVEPALMLNDYAGIQRAVETGHGISEIPSVICGRALEDGRLVEILPGWRFAPTSLSIVYPSSRNLSRLVRLFKDFCVDNLAGLAPYAAL